MSELRLPCGRWWFDPAVRLRARKQGPRNEMSAFADDVAATFADMLAGLPVRLLVFDALFVAGGLALN